MYTKRKIDPEQIISTLEQAKGGYVSGQRIAAQLGVTRTVVWYEVARLRQRGYEIERGPRRGYRLVSSPGLLREAELKEVLAEVFAGEEIPELRYFQTIDSTNLEAKRIAHEHSMKGGDCPLTLVYSQEQTEGRGRLGRSWSSHRGDGIYASLLLKTSLPAHRIPILTLLAGACICRAVRYATGFDARIKWPNDVVIDDRKLCGILTEMALEGDQIRSVILGFGINTDAESFPEEMEDLATSLKLLRIKLSPKVVIRYILLELKSWLRSVSLGDESSWEEEIRFLKEHSATLGRDVTVHSLHDAGDGYPAKAVDINPDGELIVQCQDGNLKTVKSGEVQIRKR